MSLYAFLYMGTPKYILMDNMKGVVIRRDSYSEDDTLLHFLDRIFEDATVFMMKGDSYRGKKLETLG